MRVRQRASLMTPAIEAFMGGGGGGSVAVAPLEPRAGNG
jgi:hypothetical protein